MIKKCQNLELLPLIERKLFPVYKYLKLYLISFILILINYGLFTQKIENMFGKKYIK